MERFIVRVGKREVMRFAAKGMGVELEWADPEWQEWAVGFLDEEGDEEVVIPTGIRVRGKLKSHAGLFETVLHQAAVAMGFDYTITGRRKATRPPALLNWTNPPYPEHARQEGREGTVILRVTISPEGRAMRVETAVSSGSSLLDLAALSHMGSASFSPALKHGKPVAATIGFRVKFRLIKPG